MPVVVLASISFLGASICFAADTIETYDPGAADFEFYLGGAGLNLPRYEKTVFSQVLVGYGLIEPLSGYLSVGAESDEYLVNGIGGFSSGIFGTPLDTDHVDLDLMLDAGLSGEGFTQPTITPGFELNFDLEPDLQLLGIYFRVQDQISGRDESTPDDPTTAKNEYERKSVINRATNHAFGAYVTIAERHQLLLEYYQTANSNPAQGELHLDHDGVALGYNVMLTDNLELINEVNCHIAHDDQDFTWGAYVGVIATLATQKEKPPRP